jgi:hypothetical protein
MALSASEMQEAVIRNLPDKTGRTLEEWISIARFLLPARDQQIMKALKERHGLGHVQAQTIVWRMGGDKPYVDTTGYEEAIFKHSMDRYARLKRQILGMSSDIRVKPCKTYIPFYRNKQFAIITEKKGELIPGLNLEGSDFPELPAAEKLGGSARINKMIAVAQYQTEDIERYIYAAFKSN